MPTQLGSFLGESEEQKFGNNVAPAGTWGFQAGLVFFEWDVKLNNIDDATKLNIALTEKYVEKGYDDKTVNTSLAVRKAVPSEALVVKLKKPTQGGATHRIILVDTFGSAVTLKPLGEFKPLDFTLTISGTRKLDGINNSSISHTFTINNTKGKPAVKIEYTRRGQDWHVCPALVNHHNLQLESKMSRD